MISNVSYVEVRELGIANFVPVPLGTMLAVFTLHIWKVQFN